MQNRITVVRNGNVRLKTDTHASLVTAIAAGERVGYNSRVYTGIVPEAEIFITCAPDAEAFFSGLQVLRDNGVNVINISLGFLNTTSYTYIDQMLDEFIIDSGITCVVAAGNNANGYGDGSAYINSPGYAMNCITVGNLRTKSSGASGIGAKPYSLHPSSSWEEPNSLPSEPDICAPGTWVRAVRTSTGTNPFFYDLEGAEPTGHQLCDAGRHRYRRADDGGAFGENRQPAGSEGENYEYRPPVVGDDRQQRNGKQPVSARPQRGGDGERRPRDVRLCV